MHQYAPVCTSTYQNALKYKNFHFKQNVSKLVCTGMPLSTKIFVLSDIEANWYAPVCTGMHQYAP
jgi:hypothetical protein